MDLESVHPHTIAAWFAIGCIDNEYSFQVLLPLVTGETIPNVALLETHWPSMVQGIGIFTHARVIRYWCHTHVCMREKTPVMVGCVTNPVLAVPGFMQVKTRTQREVRVTPYHNPRGLICSTQDMVLVHGHTIALTFAELSAWEAGT